MVIHHTECAMGRLTQAQIAERITATTGQVAERHDTGSSRQDPGFLYDLFANTLKEVVVQGRRVAGI